ncbi:hypothetical protein AAJP47_02445 [Psychrobacter sp. B38]|uniref:hypothetical protein n=1 Tax=Psychrobacter sp. B38 TaxID=3143538 RepID=UPI003210D2E4
MHSSNRGINLEDISVNFFILLIIFLPFLGSLSLMANNTGTAHSLWAGVAGTSVIAMHYVSNKTGIGSAKVVNSISVVMIILIIWQMILHIS